MIQARGSISLSLRTASRSRTGSHSQGLWLTNSWETLLVAVGQARRQRLDRLAAPVEHQAAQVGLTPAALVAAWQRAEHLRREGDQVAARLGKLRRLHNGATPRMVPSPSTRCPTRGFAESGLGPARANGALLRACPRTGSRAASVQGDADRPERN